MPTSAVAIQQKMAEGASLFRPTLSGEIISRVSGHGKFTFIFADCMDKTMGKSNFEQLAAYNRWANARLYSAALELPDEAYRRRVGVFFGSLHGTLNHLLTTDRLWLKRLSGKGEHPNRLDAIIHDDLIELARARIAEDERIIALVSTYDDADLDRLHAYRTTSDQPQEQRLADILQHLFNHQTHHRGQAHACYSILTGKEPPSLDLLAFQRGASTPDLAALMMARQEA